MATLTVGGHPLTLLPEKAAFLEDFRTLLVADAHIGKAVSFRSLGVPVPRGTTTENLNLLTRLVERTGAVRIVFLGDFLHSKHSHATQTLGALARWREQHAGIALTLVRGNHDDRAGDPPASLGFSVVDEPFVFGGLALCHHPVEYDGFYAVAGHLHPCVNLGGRANDTLRLPCFHFGPRLAVLPAFGSFTGMHPIRWQEGDRIFAVADDQVAEV
jgi:DNA ligase-associated metallophosphoesterase